MPADANDTKAQAFLTEFITSGDNIPLTIHGDAASSPYGSLQAAMSDLVIQTNVQGLNSPDMVRHISVEITLESLVTDLVNLNFDVCLTLVLCPLHP